jgi:hypothetical protein
MHLAPLRLRPVRRLLSAYAVNQLGDWTGEIALALAVYATTGSAAGVALVWVAHRVVLAPAAPVLVARLERWGHRPLPAVYLAQCGVFAVLTVGAHAGLAVVLPLVVLDGILAPTARALARGTLIGHARPAGLLRETNALVNVVFTANGVLAPALGGLLVASAGVPAALAADAASFVLAAAVVAGIDPATDATSAPSAMVHLRAALAHVRGNALLARLIAADAASMLLLAALTPVEVAFVLETLGETEEAFGTMLACWGAGMVLGGAAAAALPRLPIQVVLAAATLALAMSCLGIGTAAGLTQVLTWSVVGGAGNGAYGMAFVTAVQERTAEAFQTCVSGLCETVASVVPGLGFVAGGLLAALASPRAVYLVAGAGALAVLGWAATALRAADWSAREPAGPITDIRSIVLPESVN